MNYTIRNYNNMSIIGILKNIGVHE